MNMLAEYNWDYKNLNNEFIKIFLVLFLYLQLIGKMILKNIREMLC